MINKDPGSLGALTLSVEEMHLRLLLPFVTVPGLQNEIRACLAEQMYDVLPLWTILQSNEHLGLYSQELLPDLKQFLFSNGACDCVFARADPQVSQRWFRNEFRVTYDRKSGRGSDFRSSLLSFPGIELFVSPLGAGVLSMAFRLVDVSPLPLSSILRFTHDLSQMLPRKSPLIQLSGAPGQVVETETSAAFETRLGKTGRSIQLCELLHYLVLPIERLSEIRLLQTQCSAYTVVRCCADLGDESVRNNVSRFISSLAQVEEPTHAGEAPGKISVPNELLNQCHWAAVSSIGATHIICDQHLDERGFEFDNQRMPTARDKYFIPYLISLLQRLALANLVHEAEGAMTANQLDSTGKNPRIHQIRKYALQLSAQFARYSVSSRDAVNRYYRLCDRGLDLGRALQATKQTIDALEDCEQTEFESGIVRKIDQNVSALAHMQRSVAWLEVFFAAVYGMELFRALGEGLIYKPYYTDLSAVAWGALCGGIASAITKPWQHAKISRGLLLRSALVVLIAVLLWIWLGRR